MFAIDASFCFVPSLRDKATNLQSRVRVSNSQAKVPSQNLLQVQNESM